MSNVNDIEKVREYWNRFPLGTREIREKTGTKEFFDTQDKLRFDDNERFAMHFYHFDDAINKSEIRILDAGCGTGFLTRFYAKKGYDVTSVDITPEAVRLTNESLKIYGLKANVQVGNLEELLFDDDSFDHIVSNGVVHHTVHPSKAVDELFRVLKPGGKLSLAVYFRNIALRYPVWYLTRTLMGALFGKQRERSGLLTAKTPEDFVRTYDGDDTPIAYMYTKEEAVNLTSKFNTLFMEPHYFPMRFFRPSRFLPSFVKTEIHRMLDSTLGTLIYLMLEKPIQA